MTTPWKITDWRAEPGVLSARVVYGGAPVRTSVRLQVWTPNEQRLAARIASEKLAYEIGVDSGEIEDELIDRWTEADLEWWPHNDGSGTYVCSCGRGEACAHVAAFREEWMEHRLRHRDHMLMVRGIDKAEFRALIRKERASLARARHDGSFGVDIPEEDLVDMEAHNDSEAELLRRAGDPPFWTKRAPLADTLAPVYEQAAGAANEWLSKRRAP